MVNFDIALIELGKLIGFFDPGGTVRWVWFGKPIEEALETLPAERQRIGLMLQSLLPDPVPEGGAFAGTQDDPDHQWQPVLMIDAINGGFGVTWSMPVGEPLVIGIGAKASDIGGQPIDLAVLAKVLRIDGGSADHAFGDVEFAGTFPVPDFLTSGELNGAISATANPLEASVDLTAEANILPAPNGRTMSYVSGQSSPEILGWDAARLAVFVLKAFIAQRAATGSEPFFERVLEHVFPMLGDPPDPIMPFPIVDEMGEPVDFTIWSNSVLQGEDAAGPLTFLWHLRALLTGNEDPQFWPGSMFFPLIDGPLTGNPPTMADALDGQQYPPAAPGAGAWVGVLTDPPDAFTLVIDLWNAASQRHRIPIAKWDGTNLIRPPLQLNPLDLVGFGTSEVMFASGELILVSHTVPDGPLQGVFAIALALAQNQPPAIVLKTPAAFPDLAFPPDATALAADLTSSIVIVASEGTEFEALTTALSSVVNDAIRGQTPSAQEMLATLVAIASKATGGTGNDVVVPVDDVELTVGLDGADHLTAGVAYGPVTSGGDDPDLVIGKFSAGVDIVLGSDDRVLDGFQVGFEDMRLGDRGSGGGIVASLIPDMREMPGFGLQLVYSASLEPPVTLTGGGKIPIQRTFGPLEIAALLVDLREESFAVGLDLGFELGPIMVAAYELGLEIRFEDGAVTPFLHGLGLAMDTETIKLGGFFAAVETPQGQTDYVGGAVVSVAGYFELSAIGGYTQLPDDDPSLFIFASLVAPLGGPPWFFMTGVAGGFGFNRALPNPELMLDHPFLKVMRGELAVSGDAATSLKELSLLFAPEEGQFWIAAGIQFISFGFITGRVVVAIAFGHRFSFTILGMASFSLEPLAYIEIGILTTVDEEHFVLRASLSPNSYILHPDIFSLQGDIALCAWYAPPHDGDFLFSIGGYHPEFKKPDHYPELVRVGAKATLYEFVHLSVEVFFACTPQALMAGAKAALWGEFMGIAAGCEVYVDVLITWDPFFLRAGLGVVLWFEFFGRHEIGVHLDIYTPEFGGTATIDLAIVSFEVSFGAEIGEPPAPQISEFMTKQLALPANELPPATGIHPAGARVPAFNTADAPGLLRVEFLSGRVGTAADEESEQQEGTDQAAPVRLGPEWSFLVRTRLPLDPDDVPADGAAFPPVVAGDVNLPLCRQLGLTSRLAVTSPALDDPEVSDAIGRAWVTDFHPAATFGPSLLDTGQTGTQAAAKLDSATPSVPLVEGMFVDCGPEVPTAPPLSASRSEKSPNSEAYPLPLGDEAPGQLVGVADHFFFAAAPLQATAPSGGSRRDSALTALRGRTRAPLTALLKSAALLNPVKHSAAAQFSVAATAAAAIPHMSPPLSPARPVELQPVRLKVLSIRSDHATSGRKLETVTSPAKFTERLLTGTAGARGIFRAAIEVPAGEAQLLEFGGGGAAAAALRMSGHQHVRTVAFDRAGGVVLDRHARGAGSLKLPASTATVAFIGSGSAAAPATAGVEPDTALLAVNPRSFLAPGCVVTTRTPLHTAVRALDGMPGAELFAGARSVDVSFQALKKAAALIIRVVPVVERPGPAERQVRWRAIGARLRDLVPVVGADAVSLTMAVAADRAWRLEIDLGPEWRLDGIAVVPGGTEALVAQLRRGGGRDLVDDAIAPPSELVTKVNVEARA
ncbi:DUF6603 domain-containing protein [Mycolicibacterium holsaticum]|uniref:DUF6603 domain-containing protein n=1 Tax=Mycolicibacterium holsaticum TaxID=152142 RepID=UPI001C7D6481|nr:DUF6603 domain-containing protein [Mycolicibacterium holsaticum]MDA4107835.1 hypothetical protein [Mycolicibacterium holsaticum DSM 44478 = JCM 12374]QZA14722.1 hypothetical protein K3U96_11845 [Mycolicibacterium holsaticum DSM 44478 = JCM 12374]UNC07835.1 hypothetical protein H5U41_14990 [Mycolicibacterium holsaticum DSM 44478 = JCM 12374]